MNRDPDPRALSEKADEILRLLYHGTVVDSSDLARQHADVPAWLRVCREIATARPHALPVLLNIGGKGGDAPHALERRVVRLVARELGVALPGASAEDEPATLAEDWLLEWLHDPLPQPAGAGAARQVRTHLVLLREEWTDGRLTQMAERFTLTLRLRSARRRPEQAGRFLPAPACLTTDTDDAFHQSLARASQVVRRWVRDEAWASSCAFEWDITPGPGSTLAPLADESASAAFAVAALRLLRAHALADIHDDLQFADIERACISACLANEEGHLREARGIDQKVRILPATPGPDGPDAWIHVAGDPAEPVHDRRLIPSLDVRGLLSALATQGARGLAREHRALLRCLLDGQLPPQPLLDAVAAPGPVSTLAAHLLQRYGHWASSAQSRLHQRFENLSLVDSSLPLEHRQQPFTQLAQLLALPQAAGAAGFLLFGEPGCGKSTLLQRHEMDLALQALQTLFGHADLGARSAPLDLCVFLKLADYSIARQKNARLTPLAWMTTTIEALGSAIGEPALLDPQDRARRNLRPIRLRLVLDGLNEMRERSQSDLSRRMRAFSRAVHALRKGGALLPALFSVREGQLDELSHDGFVVHQVRVNRWDDDQRRRYVWHRLGWPGRPLLRMLRKPQDPRVGDMLGLPLNLAAQCEAFEAGLRRLAEGPAELLSALVWGRLKRAYRAGELDFPGLLNESDRTAIASNEHWLRDLKALPVGGVLVAELDRQGDAQWRHAGLATPLSDRDTGAVTVDERSVATGLGSDALREAWFTAVRALGLARVEWGTDGKSRTFSFTHQLLGEFFAARGLFKGEADLSAFAAAYKAPRPVPLQRAYGALGDDGTLSLPPLAALDPAFKYAIEFVANTDELVARLRAVMSGNPTLCAWAARRVLGRLEQCASGRLLLDDLRRALLRRMRRHTDLRVRVEAGLALGAVGDTLRYEKGEGPHGPYLVPSLKYWVTIHGGHYTIGSERGEGEDEETPTTEVELQAFGLASYPVTNAEWKCFIKGDGYRDPRWWGKGDSLAWLQRPQQKRMPFFWDDNRVNNALQPVVGITYWECLAYIRWLNAQTKGSTQPGRERQYRLPTEAEWEAAARGVDRLVYAWGDVPPDPDRCNFGVTRLRTTSPVGAFPRGDRHAQDGRTLSDLTGNVFEWTSSRYTDRLDSGALTRATTNLDGDDVRLALRGGYWLFAARGVRAACRLCNVPGAVFDGIGLRLAGVPIEFSRP